MASHPPSAEASDAAGSRPAVVIACAVADASVAGDAARALRERGHDVELVAGADDSGDILALTVHKFDRQGLYVLCRSARMDRASVDNLRAVLRKEGVPFGRTLTLALESGTGAARALEDRILSVARRMVTGRGDSGPVNAPAILPPPTTKVTKAPEPPAEMGEDIDTRVTQQQPEPFPAAKPGAVEVKDEDVDAWADSLAGRRVIRPEPDYGQTTSVDQAFDGDPLGGAGAPSPAEDDPSEALGADGGSTLVGAAAADDDDPQITEPSPLRRLSNYVPPGDEFAPSGVDRTQVNKSPDVVKFEPVRGSPLPLAADAPFTGGGSSPGTPAAAPSGTSLEVAQFKTGPSKGAMLMVGGGLLALGLLGLLIAVLPADEDGENADTKTVAQANAAAEKKGASKPADPTPPPDDSADAPSDDSAAPEDSGDQVAEAGADVDGEPVNDAAGDDPGDEDTADDPDPADSDSGSPPADTPPPPPPPSDPGPGPGPASVEDSDLVLAALDSRAVRAIDTFLVAAEPSRSIDFASAEAFCAGLDVQGLKAWRLPTIGELNSLNEARLFKSGILWSETLGDAYGDQRLVFNLKKTSIGAVSAGWGGAQAVCIRERT